MPSPFGPLSATMFLTLEDVGYRVLPRVAPGRALAHSEWRTLCRVADTLLNGCPAEISPEQTADNVERFLIEGRSRRAWRVRVLLTLIEYVTLPAYGARFSDLDATVRRRVIEERFVGGRHVWGICAKIRLLVMTGVYGDANSHRAIGFVPVAQRPRHRAASALARRGNGALQLATTRSVIHDGSH